ncbi:MAG: cytochrome c-type biogenesis protein CcmH [Acidimicrobiia bacterium]|nr:cytochrome c-type biogenesis protein CcmH [Acidimicrobiia bacterium]
MSSFRSVLGWIVAVAAVAVIAGGLWPEAAEADPDAREHQLSQRIACPWCDGQSLAESDSEVAKDLVVILRDRIDAGWSDGEIFDFFASSYGDHVLLDPPLTGWGIVLWSLPALGLIVGSWIIWQRRGTRT